jgi:hypothetical protein
MSQPILPYPILFNQTPDSLRRIGARGGRTCARNRRLRQRIDAATAHSLRDPVVPALETTAQAIATLDAQFPWLRQAQRRSHR